MNNKKGFIQISLLITIIIGILVLSGGGYFGVKQYQSSKNTEVAKEMQDLKEEFENLKKEKSAQEPSQLKIIERIIEKPVIIPKAEESKKSEGAETDNEVQCEQIKKDYIKTENARIDLSSQLNSILRDSDDLFSAPDSLTSLAWYKYVLEKLNARKDTHLKKVDRIDDSINTLDTASFAEQESIKIKSVFRTVIDEYRKYFDLAFLAVKLTTEFKTVAEYEAAQKTFTDAKIDVNKAIEVTFKNDHATASKELDQRYAENQKKFNCNQ